MNGSEFTQRALLLAKDLSANRESSRFVGYYWENRLKNSNSDGLLKSDKYKYIVPYSFM